MLVLKLMLAITVLAIGDATAADDGWHSWQWPAPVQVMVGSVHLLMAMGGRDVVSVGNDAAKSIRFGRNERRGWAVLVGERIEAGNAADAATAADAILAVSASAAVETLKAGGCADIVESDRRRPMLMLMVLAGWPRASRHGCRHIGAHRRRAR